MVFSPTHRAQAPPPVRHCCLPETLPFDASPARAFVLARKKHARCFALLADNASLLATSIPEGSRHAILFSKPYVILVDPYGKNRRVVEMGDLRVFLLALKYSTCAL